MFKKSLIGILAGVGIVCAIAAIIGRAKKAKREREMYEGWDELFGEDDSE